MANEKVSKREKLCYGVGDASNGLAVSSVGLFYLKYLTDIVHLSPKYAGYALLIGRVWDAMTDPLMGWITDHTESRWGKRRPYLLFGAIPYALAFLSLWVVPNFTKEIDIFIYVSLTLLVFNTCLTVVFVPYTSLTAAITDDYHERTSLTSYRMTSTMVAMLLGSVLPSALIPVIVANSDSSFFQMSLGGWNGTERGGFAIMGVIFAFFMIASILAAFWGTRERDFEANKSKSTAAPIDYVSSIISELQGNKPFKISVLILMLTNCATTLITVVILYYVQYVLRLSEIEGIFGMKQETIILAIIFCIAISSIPLVWSRLAQKYGKTETYVPAMCMYVFVMLALPLVPEQSPYITYFVASLAGVFHGAALMIPWAIVPDVVEFDELKTGRRREGLFYGGTTFSYKLATALALLISSLTLEYLDYVPNQLEQPSAVINGIKVIIGPLPALILVSAILLARKYPLTYEKHQLILEELATIKKKATQQ